MPARATISGPPKPPCTRYPLDVFFPKSESSFTDRPTAGERAALSICAGCPLASRTQCLVEALSYPIADQYGVVGGTTSIQRQVILQGRQQEQLAGLTTSSAA